MRSNERKVVRFWMVWLLVAALAAALAGTVLASDPGEPEPGTVRGLSGPHAIYAASTGLTATTYTASPNTIYGQDVSLTWLYHAMDVFVSVDVSGTDTITVTPQFSADAANWANTYYQTVSGTTVTAHDYRVVLSADGTNYVRVPLAGKYTRFKIETGGTVTPTIRVLLRND